SPRRIDLLTYAAPEPGRRTRRPRRRAAHPPTDLISTRDKILGAAYRTLVDVGYNQISMRKIAEEARVNQSLLHYYYGSKENLMLEVLEYVNEQLLARQRKMYQEVRSFEAIWATALEYFKEDMQSGYVRGLWELRAQGLSNVRIQKRLAEMIGRWRDLVAELARQGLAEHGIEGTVDPRVLGRLIGDLYFGAEAEILGGEDPQLHVEAIRLMGNLMRWMAQDARARKRREAAAGDS
ncbi:MAG TPA: TetR/AcrR family transcriptional regulator, partial [bacterium]|nr:TetR/AcrR family transcriptional regulator [bacterium]